MDDRIAALEQEVAALRAAVSAAAPTPTPQPRRSPAVADLPDPALMAATDALGRLIRDAEAMLSSVAGEIARRSPSHIGKDGLAKRQGYQSPARLVAAATGGAVAAAARMVKVGTATAPRSTPGGEELPAAHPHVAGALASGRVSVESAAAITTMLDRVAPRADPAQADAVEAALAERATQLPHELMMKVIGEAEARLDQFGLAPREAELHEQRALRISEDAAGCVKVSARLDPETGAFVTAAIESLVTAMIRTERAGHVTGAADPGAGAAGPDGDPVVPDRRTVAQLQADALGMIARHVLGCSRMPQAPASTVVVRCDLETLTDGSGHAEIDGAAHPVSATTARRMAAASGLIPAVFDGDPLPLDLGRDSRLFTRAQRLALYERDGGCACCGLDAAYTEAHHIRWWQRDSGPTDLTNGVLLCPPCHTRIHNDGWDIRVRDGDIWFTPPPHVDPSRRPRLGGKARFRLPSTTPS